MEQFEYEVEGNPNDPERMPPPDIEPKTNETEIATDEVEIEVVDDTPEKDRNRDPLPAEELAALEEDAEEYSEAVQKRIDKLTRARHDERREKERLQRERDELARAAQAYKERYEQTANKYTQENEWSINNATRRAELELLHAKAKMKQAQEEGDTDAFVEAQHDLTHAQLLKQQLDQWIPQQQAYTQQQQEYLQQSALQQQQNDVYMNQQPQKPVVDENTQAWMDKNDWFGTDQEMTANAMVHHETLVNEGVEPGSAEYFEQIDARVRKRFADRFESEKPRQKQRPSTVVAPAGRSPAGRKVVLTETQLKIAHDLGVSPQDYAKAMLAGEHNV